MPMFDNTEIMEFRAWDKEKKEMIYSGVELELRLISTPNNDLPPEDFIGFGLHCFSRFVIMQGTGLVDYSRKKLFDKDIVEKECRIDKKDPVKELYIVRWDNFTDYEYVDYVQCWMIGTHSLSNDLEDMRMGKHKIQYCAGHTIETKITVVGNVFETPELLDGVKNGAYVKKPM